MGKKAIELATAVQQNSSPSRVKFSMPRVIAGGLSGLESLGIAQAAYHAGYSGLVSLELVSDEDVERFLDTMVLSHAEFTASVAAISPELMRLLGRYSGRGLKEVLLCEPSSTDLPA